MDEPHRRGTRVAVVTGAASGIGQAVAAVLDQAGWDVVSLDLTPSPTSSLDLGPVNVTNPDQVETAMHAVVEQYGGLDLLVNAAGISEHSPVASMDLGSWQRVLDVNLGGTLTCMRAAAQPMLARGHGCVVNISSISAVRGAPGRAAYCASKAAVEALTRVAAVEWAGHGVSVNAIAPGYVDSPMLRDAFRQGKVDLDEVMARVPSRTLIDPTAIGQAIEYLTSQGGRYVTGQVITIDAGFLADYGVGSSATQHTTSGS